MNLADSDSDDELPPGWEERVTAGGYVYYANHLTKNTQWTHPRTGKKKKVAGNLPFGWERIVTQTGQIIYVNHETERTTYTDPRLAFAVEEKEHATDFRQRFDASSTALQILHGRDLSGKVAVITGANTGIGFETARSLAKHGCTVIFACRNLAAAEESIDKIRSEERLNIADNCIAIHLDLSSLASVVQFGNTIKSRYHKVDIIILNAGVFGLPYTKTLDGFEMTFQVNHLSHFYLTLLLEPLFVQGSRIVIVSSESHRFANLTSASIDPLTLSPETWRHYWNMTAYNNSKLCNVLFARQLAKNLQGKGVSVFSLHPGNMVSTGLSRHWWLYRLLFAFEVQATSVQEKQNLPKNLDTKKEGHNRTVELRPQCKQVTWRVVGIEAPSDPPSNPRGIYFNNCCPCQESEMAKNDEMALLLWNTSIDMIQSVLGNNAPGLEEKRLGNKILSSSAQGY
ncbi:WW domain-containing oxidoreductase [Sitophilus oryzae]|uniref:WW domain-containing oxidoreductase n=1 Tax=Sitophilus oryzae TaxID=7048 RepID=A0A6J2X829_SITOR|nr:WW domain-containing oxidoreductase [Sitophilus oryzae]